MNEPAFPMFKPRIENYCEEEIIPGMTLRDYFAAKAMPEVFELHNRIYEDPKYDQIAEASYLMADAMLKSRTEQKGE